ncbi:MAG: hypothetical protein ACLFR0_00550 [Alphaproteobacteria bacterium]
MYTVTNKPEMGARFYSALVKLAQCQYQGLDSMKVIQYMAGVLVETYLVFENPAETMEGSFAHLCNLLKCEPFEGELGEDVLPPAHILDSETERGRTAARIFFEDWMDCEYEFHGLVLEMIRTALVHWEMEGVPREENLRLLIDCTKLAMAFEISAQELCDAAIDYHVNKKGWTLSDCIGALSAVAGRRLAISLNSNTCMIFKGCEIPDNLDKIVYVMTKEAVRLGVPAGGDWRFGLAANDMPINAPIELIQGMEPVCSAFFDVINLPNNFVQAVACAKAAGRMIAVASGGEVPDIEPAIAKPLAMCAMTESYKYVCLDYKSALG